MHQSVRPHKAPQAADTAPGKRSMLYTTTLVLIVVLAMTLFVVLYVRSYRNLGDSIQAERRDYVDEIARQIITNQRFMESEYARTAASFAGMLNRMDNATLRDIRENFATSPHTQILLINDSGRIINAKGEAIYFSNRKLLQSVVLGNGTTQLFSSLNNVQDFWLFTSPLQDVTVDGARYHTLVLAISAEEFRANLTVSLFDNRGASYIIQLDGSIEIKPDSREIAFGGYNLFTSMLSQGANPAQVALLQEGVAQRKSGGCLIDIQGAEWLASYSSLDQANAIVVMVPLTITAAQTYAGFSRTILFASFIVICVAVLGLIVILLFFQRDRERHRQAMAVAAKSDFFSKMSHDIRTPLNAIIGLELLARDSADNPAAVTEYLQKSTEAAHYLQSIINDVLDMSRIESGKFTISHTPFDMNELLSGVRDLMHEAAHQKDLAFDIASDAHFDRLYLGDPVRIKQIVVNLVSNAIKFTMPGGRVEVTASHQENPQNAAGDMVTIIVRDTGIGMSDAYMTRIFMPFEQERESYTDQHTGSGLGLAIVYNLVTLMGGAIHVDSREEEGSTFTVTLPLERGEPVVIKALHAQKPEGVFEGFRVLVAEDNTVNQQVICAILRRRFHLESDVAADGLQAVRLFEKSPPGHYDLILMDVKMPVMDGLEATRRIRALDRPDAARVPVVALSANAFDDDVRLSIEAGMDKHLSKPVDISALAATLSSFLQRKEVSP